MTDTPKNEPEAVAPEATAPRMKRGFTISRRMNRLNEESRRRIPDREGPRTTRERLAAYYAATLPPEKSE